MKEKDLNLLLLNEFPELKDRFDEETSWQDGINTGSFIVYEDVFMPFLEMNVEMKNEKMIKRIYAFIEKLSNIHDAYVENVFFVGILENIHDYVETEKFTCHLIGNSKRIYFENFDK